VTPRIERVIELKATMLGGRIGWAPASGLRAGLSFATRAVSVHSSDGGSDQGTGSLAEWRSRRSRLPVARNSDPFAVCSSRG
jgi:hypothetical protein